MGAYLFMVHTTTITDLFLFNWNSGLSWAFVSLAEFLSLADMLNLTNIAMRVFALSISIGETMKAS